MRSKLYDVAVVGAGLLGLCIGRDLGSSGVRTVVLEREAHSGGVWYTSQYPGLRVHGPPAAFRCLSLVPNWQTSHSTGYRPFRDEVLDYCRELEQSSCLEFRPRWDYTHLSRVGRAIRLYSADGRIVEAKVVILALGLHLTASGRPYLPPELRGRPRVVHSSGLVAEVWKRVSQAAGKIYVLGSGKAAVEVLEALRAANLDLGRVRWVHRGHTMFLNRDMAELLGWGSLLQEVGAAVFGGRSYQQLLDRGLLIACSGPLTRQRVKLGFGVSSGSELARLAKVEQVLLEGLDPSGELVRTDGSLLRREAKDWLIACTGQRCDFWQRREPPIEVEVKGVVLTTSFSPVAPVNGHLSTRIALDLLDGDCSAWQRSHDTIARMFERATSPELQDPRLRNFFFTRSVAEEVALPLFGRDLESEIALAWGRVLRPRSLLLG